MTNPNNAAQAAEQEAVRRVLEPYAESYDMMARMAKREGRDASVGVHAVAYDIRWNMIPGVIDALSKLRAEGEPVAGLPAYITDDRYHLQYRLGWNNCLADCRAAMLASAPVASAPADERATLALDELRPPGTGYSAQYRSGWSRGVGDATQAVIDALASPPVAGEAQQPAKITFVNGDPASCGCTIRFSDGGGEYSDVHCVSLCGTHSGAHLLSKVIKTGELTRPQHEDLEGEICAALDPASPQATNAAPQASEAVPTPLSVTRYSDQSVLLAFSSCREASAYQRAAQPQADKDGGQQHTGDSALTADDVQWVVNDIAELGVKIGSQFFFLYKGHSLVYESAEHDDGSPMHWRPVFKREFGECAHPINYTDPTRIGTVSLHDSDDWKPLPSALSATQTEQGERDA